MRRGVHDILEELLKAVIASNVTVVARCIMQLVCIHNEYTESSLKSNAQTSRKRSILDDQIRKNLQIARVMDAPAGIVGILILALVRSFWWPVDCEVH